MIRGAGERGRYNPRGKRSEIGHGGESMSAAPAQDDSKLAPDLLAYLRARLSEPTLAYAELPAQLTGGYDTAVYAFRLGGASGEFGRPLILRVFPSTRARGRPQFESAVQNALADGGYPAPRVLLVEPETHVGGGPFIVMERVRGVTIDRSLPAALFRLPGWLAGAQARLHELDPDPLLRALRDAGVGADFITFDGWLSAVERRIDGSSGLSALRPGLEWLRAERPPPPERLAICHCDFHPSNVLVENGAVTGVVDWAMVRIADPALDVGITIVTMTMGPMEIPRLLERPASLLRRYLGRRYLSAYRQHRPVEERRVRYYAAFRCFAAMSRVLEGDRPGYAWGSPKVFGDLRSYFARVSGIELRAAV